MFMDRQTYPYSIPVPLSLYKVKNPSKHRLLFWITLSNTMGKYDRFRDLPIDKKTAIVSEIEKQCLNTAVIEARKHNINCVWDDFAFICNHQNICFRITSILDIEDEENGSRDVFDKLLSGEMSCSYLVATPLNVLCPEKFQHIEEKIKIRSNVQQTQKEATMYTCRKCKTNRTTFKTVQKNSNDEPSKNEIKCLFCGFEWIAY